MKVQGTQTSLADTIVLGCYNIKRSISFQTPEYMKKASPIFPYTEKLLLNTLSYTKYSNKKNMTYHCNRKPRTEAHMIAKKRKTIKHKQRLEKTHSTHTALTELPENNPTTQVLIESTNIKIHSIM